MYSDEALILAIAGKIADRTTWAPEVDFEMKAVEARYQAPVSEKDDHLHKQAIRALARKANRRVHITTLGESGFLVELGRDATRVKELKEREPVPAPEPEPKKEPDKVEQLLQELLSAVKGK